MRVNVRRKAKKSNFLKRTNVQPKAKKSNFLNQVKKISNSQYKARTSIYQASVQAIWPLWQQQILAAAQKGESCAYVEDPEWWRGRDGMSYQEQYETIHEFLESQGFDLEPDDEALGVLGIWW